VAGGSRGGGCNPPYILACLIKIFFQPEILFQKYKI